MHRSYAAPLVRMARSRLARARALCITLVLAVAPLAGSCSGDVYGGAEPDDLARALAIVPTCPTRGTRTHDVRVTQVALYQALKVPLYQDGRWLSERAVPIIAGKQALVRVFVEPDDDYRPRSLRAVLRIAHGDHVVRLSEERRLSARSIDEELASTFNLDVAAALITPEAKLSVALEEGDCTPSRAADERASAAIDTPLGAELRRTLRVVLVPMRVDGRVPALTPSSAAHITDALRAFFPVPAVEVLVDDAIDGETSVRADDATAWKAMVERVRRHRLSKNPEDDVYYVGVFQPAASRAAYCMQGRCTLGLAPVARPHSVNLRYGLAAFFGDESGGETVAHELGHAHGLKHVFCPGMQVVKDAHGDDGFDHGYPSTVGALDAWGWDVRTGALLPPTNHDLMSYCAPYGIGPHTYKLLAERTRLVDQVTRAP